MQLEVRHREIQDGTVEILKRYLHPDHIWLFGSRAKGNAQPTSDFDMAVDTTTPEFDVLSRMREEIDHVSGLYQVDVVFLNSVKPYMQKVVKETGKIIYG